MAAVSNTWQDSAVAKSAGEVADAEIAAVLDCHFGDGLVYLPRNRPRRLFDLAVDRGFINAEGYLTRKGRALLAHFHYA